MKEPLTSNQQCAPCPFCGGTASVWGSWLYSSRGPFSGHVHCETPNCSHGPEGRGETVEKAGNAAIAAWNKRPVAAINPADFEKWRAADETSASLNCPTCGRLYNGRGGQTGFPPTLTCAGGHRWPDPRGGIL